MSKMELGAISDSSFGAPDVFGLDEFGQPMGTNPVWGAIAGAGFQTATAMAVRQMAPSMEKYAEGLGALAGILAGGVMWYFPGTRAAGVTAMATAAVGGGLRQIETFLKKDSAAVHGYFGAPVIETNVPMLRDGMQLGLVQAEAVPRLGEVAPNVTVMGPPVADYGIAGPAAAQAQLLGGPQLSGLGSHFGATLFSNG